MKKNKYLFYYETIDDSGINSKGNFILEISKEEFSIGNINKKLKELCKENGSPLKENEYPIIKFCMLIK